MTGNFSNMRLSRNYVFEKIILIKNNKTWNLTENTPRANSIGWDAFFINVDFSHGYFIRHLIRNWMFLSRPFFLIVY